MQSNWLWTEAAKPFVGKMASGTFSPFTMRVVDGSVWQSRQSALENVSTALVAAKAVDAAKRKAASKANGGNLNVSCRRL
jgi:hypothetical protein